MRRILTLALAAVALPAAAHPGHGLEAAGFAAGLAHPFTGLDHLVALLASGFLAARLSRNSGLVLLAAVLAALAGGAILAHGTAGWSWIEAGIAVMLMALGAWLLLPVQQARALKIATVIVFALFHGAVHGAEAPTGAHWVLYLTGLLTASAIILSLGWLASKHITQHWVVPTAGSTITLFGAWLAWAL